MYEGPVIWELNTHIYRVVVKKNTYTEDTHSNTEEKQESTEGLVNKISGRLHKHMYKG